MIIVDVEQNSLEWRKACSGSLGSSTMPAIVRRIRDGSYSTSRANMIAAKLLERFTGVMLDGTPITYAMAQGKKREPEARGFYEIVRAVEVVQVGLVRHPRIKWAHASPDGLVGQDGLVEIKAPLHATHLETLRTGKVDRDYLVQMQWQLAVTERTWCDHISFNPDFPAAAMLWIRRFERDDEMIGNLEMEAYRAIEEIEENLMFLKERYGA